MKFPIRLLSAVFLAALLWQMIGFLCFYEWQHTLVKKSVKHLMKNSVPVNQRITFIFSTAEIQQLTWIKSHEFKLNGRYYDVLERKDFKGFTRMNCIDDQQETQLFKRLNESTALNLWGGGKHKPLKHLMQLLQTPFVPLSSLEIVIVSQDTRHDNGIYQFQPEPLVGFNNQYFTPPEWT
jgi:hypothetical protein